jgi:peptide chain release factor 1
VQRVPPTERSGRIHTSTVTVAIIDPKEAKLIEFNDRDFRIEWYSGSGAGGQHRNRHMNSCRIFHTSSGVMATAQCRSRENSLKEAKVSILERLNSKVSGAASQALSIERRTQMGTGQRGDKIRTYRLQDNIVKDHNTGKQAQTDKVMAGNFQLLWR